MSSKSFNDCFYYGLKRFKLKEDMVVILNNVLSKLKRRSFKKRAFEISGSFFRFYHPT
jgi:hypothetical protein